MIPVRAKLEITSRETGGFCIEVQAEAEHTAERLLEAVGMRPEHLRNDETRLTPEALEDVYLHLLDEPLMPQRILMRREDLEDVLAWQGDVLD